MDLLVHSIQNIKILDFARKVYSPSKTSCSYGSLGWISSKCSQLPSTISWQIANVSSGSAIAWQIKGCDQ